MKLRRKQVLYGWVHERLEAKIRHMLSLPLGQRYDAGLAKGDLAKRLEQNQWRLFYGSRTSRRLQILQRPPR